MSAWRQARRSSVAAARSAMTLAREPPETMSALMVTPRRRSFHFSRRAICAASSCTALMPFSGARPAWEARPWTMSSASPTPLREVFSKPRGPSDGSSTKTASLRARFFFNQFARGFAADLFVGSPQKNQAFLHRGLQFANGFEREERLNDAGFHVERAGAVGFPAGNAKRHFGESAGGIDGVVVAEDEELRFYSAFRGFPDHAEMIAAVFLPENLRNRAVVEPFFREEFAAAVGWLFFQAGRFEERQFAQRLHHLRQAFAKVGKERKLGHGKGMVARPAIPIEINEAQQGPLRPVGGKMISCPAGRIPL